MVRSTAIRFALLVGTLALGGLGAALYRHHTALQRQAWDGDGRALYWQVRRTHHVHEPWELADQLSRRREEPKDVLDTCFALLFLKRATKEMVPAPITPADQGPVDNR